MLCSCLLNSRIAAAAVVVSPAACALSRVVVRKVKSSDWDAKVFRSRICSSSGVVGASAWQVLPSIANPSPMASATADALVCQANRIVEERVIRNINSCAVQ